MIGFGVTSDYHERVHSAGPLPIRVLVKGASTVNWTSFMGGPRSDLAFSRVAEQHLLAAGRPAKVTTRSMPSEQASTLLGSWQEEVLGYSPDVIVLVYGHYETLHLFLPRWLERHANSMRARPRRIGTFYRTTVLRPLWKQLARLQAFADRVVPSTVRHRQRQVVADVGRYIEHVQQVASPLVLVFELLPPHGRAAGWFPGAGERMSVMNEALEQMVARIDRPDVRWFTVRDLVADRLGGAVALAQPDGFHYTPDMHRWVGEKLGATIDAWAEGQTHLRAGD